MATVCFTGHRPQKLYGYNMDSVEYIELRSFLKKAIANLIENHNAHTFIFGGALGIDQIAFSICEELKEKYPTIKLVLAKPFEHQSIKWKPVDQRQLRQQERVADEVVLVDALADTKYYCKLNGVGNYHPVKMQKRNEYMVDKSNIILSIWNGSQGGTKNCIDYALSANSKYVFNIDPREVGRFKIARVMRTQEQLTII